MLHPRALLSSIVLMASLAAACRGGETIILSGPSSSSSGSSSGAGGGGGESATSSTSSSGAGAGPDAGPPACSPDVPRTGPLDVFAEPDNGQTPYYEPLTQATSTIRVMVYLMGYGSVLDTLLQKAQAGLDVRVILDQSQKDTNQKYFDMLAAAGATVKWSSPSFTYMHAKVMIVDDQVAIVSSGNYSQYQIAKERNYVLHDRDPQDIASLTALFDADWSGAQPDLSCTRLIVSPANSHARLLAFIQGATTTLLIESMQFADDDVRAAVAERVAAGVDVRVIVADPGWITANTDAAAFLHSIGVPVKYLSDPGVHVKALVADGERALTGSLNVSWTSINKNREVSLIVNEPAGVATIATTFEVDWDAGTDL